MKFLPYLFAFIAISLFFSTTTFAQEGGLITGEFSLIDHNGQPVTHESYNGKYRLVFFGYTACPDVCPTSLMYLSSAMNQLGDQSEQIQPLFIDIDPNEHTPTLLKNMMNAFHESFVGLTGTPDAIEQAAINFGAKYGKTPSAAVEGAYDIYHSAHLYLMGPNNEFLDIFGYGVTANDIVEGVEPYLQ